MADAVYAVVPVEGEAGWLVNKGTTSLSRHGTEEEAVEAAWKLCLANQPSQLMVHDREGEVTMRRRFDVSPPAGLG
jgi:hypothetical protein